MTARMTIGQFLKRRREQLELSQMEVAKQIGYKLPNFISNIENDKAPFPIGRWKDFANVLQLDRTKFLMRVLKEFYPEMLDYLQPKEPVESPDEIEDENPKGAGNKAYA